MSLQAILDLGRGVNTAELASAKFRPAVLSLQTILCDLGILDPIIGGSETRDFGPIGKADGSIGQNTRNAIYEFCRLSGLAYDQEGGLSLAAIHTLAVVDPNTFINIVWDNAPDDTLDTRFAKRVLRYMRKKGYWIARSPNACNIIYLEGVNANGSLNADEPNQWNDRRLVVRIAPGGKPEILLNQEATTEPGIPSVRMINPSGTARIGFGQYKSWKQGLHKERQLALVQTGPVKIYRDKNRDHQRDGDKVYVGVFGINQHSTNNLPLYVGNYSIGCLVGRYYQEHLQFLLTVKSDYRFLLNTEYTFISTVISGKDLQKEEPA
ncbi:MAG: peptidoglycan-binding protein [Bacteroidetes bacterium]|nr:peptidoglycan-binding protein [Bacteroidota bacterium]